MFSYIKANKYVITGLYTLRYPSACQISCEEIYGIQIYTKPADIDDVKLLKNYPNLEQITMTTTDEGFLIEFSKFLDCFDNLYDIDINCVKYVNDINTYKKLITNDIYDLPNFLFIKNLIYCNIHPKINLTSNKCEKCCIYTILQNTKSQRCLIQNFQNSTLLNALSPNIKNLTVCVQSVQQCIMKNLPFTLETLTIVYSEPMTPEIFYSLIKNNIKIPYNCKLKIIQKLNVNYASIDARHLIIKDI